MISLRKTLNLMLYILILSLFVLAASFIVSNRTLILTSDTLLDGIIAFFGAFFAFAFLKFSDWLSAIRKGGVNHFNALVKIERLLNRVISRLEKNILLCQEDIVALRSMKMIVWNLPPVPFSHELADDLRNIDFINDYFTYMIDIETLTNDLSSMVSMYNEVKSLLIAKTIGPETYKDNVEFTIMRVSEIIKFMESYQAEAIKLAAKARILIKERKRRIFLMGPLPKKHYGKNFDTLLKEEIAILEKEIELIKRRSQEEIDRIKGLKPDTQKKEL